MIDSGPAGPRFRHQAQVELQLPGSDPLPGDSLQGLQLGLVVRRPDVLDAP